MAGPLNSNIPTSPVHDVLVEGEVLTDTEGTITAGARAISVKNMGANQGTFDGIPIDSLEVFNYPWTGFSFGTIEYDARGTEFKIIVFR